MRPSRIRVSAVMAAAALAALSHAAWAAPGRRQDAGGLAALIFSLLIGMASLAALELLVMAIGPGAVNAARDMLVAGRQRCLLAGFGALVGGGLLAIIIGQAGPPGAVLGVLLFAAIVFGILIGLPAVALLVGKGVLEMSGRTPSTLAAVAWGLAFILLAGAFPLVGWILFVYLAAMGLGAAVLAATRRRPPVPEPAPEEPLPGVSLPPPPPDMK